MGYSKRQFVEKAFAKIGLAGYVFDLSPEEFQDAVSDLDAMLAFWNGKGIRVGWPMPSSPQFGDLDEQTDVPDSANMAIINGLGVMIAPNFGKTVPQTVAFFAKQGYDLLLSLAAVPMEKQLPSTMPSGAGNKPWRTYDSPFIRPPIDPLLSGPDGPIEFD